LAVSAPYLAEAACHFAVHSTLKDHHVAAIIAKLGVRSRGQALSAAAGFGSEPGILAKIGTNPDS